MIVGVTKVEMNASKVDERKYFESNKTCLEQQPLERKSSVRVAEGLYLDFGPTGGLVYLSGPFDVQYVICIDLLPRPPLITYLWIRLENMPRTSRPINNSFARKDRVLFLSSLYCTTPIYTSQHQMQDKRTQKYKITVHKQRDHEDCLMNIQVPGNWSLDCPSPLLQNIWPLLGNYNNFSISQETIVMEFAYLLEMTSVK